MKRLFLRILLVPLAVTGVLLTLTGRRVFGQDASQGAKQDMKDAGHSTKNAAKHTGRATKKATKRGVNKSARAVNKGSRKVQRKTEPQP